MKKKENNKEFGILFFIVFLIIGLWPLLNNSSIRIWALIVALLFLVLGILNLKILTPLKKGWIKFGELLGKIISPIIMGFIFFLIITPIGLFMRLIGKDLLNLKYNNDQSYWTKRSKDINTMKKQF
tara:strand:- start:60 stop:437 length:378 start_codon:yes stop_codon:yes gene_type:complete